MGLKNNGKILNAFDFAELFLLSIRSALYWIDWNDHSTNDST